MSGRVALFSVLALILMACTPRAARVNCEQRLEPINTPAPAAPQPKN